MPYAKGCKPGDSKRADKRWPKLPAPVAVPKLAAEIPEDLKQKYSGSTFPAAYERMVREKEHAE